MAKSITETVQTSGPVLPLRDIVVFPHMVVPLFVGREKSVKALEAGLGEGREILLLTQKTPTQEEPTQEDLFTIGTVATVLQLLRLPDGTVKVLVEGLRRAKVKEFTKTTKYIEAVYEPLPETGFDHEDMEAWIRTCHAQFEQYVNLNKKIPQDVVKAIQDLEDPSTLTDSIVAHLTLQNPLKQEVLELSNVFERLEKICNLLEGEIDVMQAESRIRTRVKGQMEKSQKDYYLNEQLKAIHRELGAGEEGKDELSDLEEKFSEIGLTKEALEKAQGELKKLRMMPPMSSESTVVRNYLDWIVSIPWKDRSDIKTDLKEAQEVLDHDHYGLEKVKERILEYLAVQKRVGKVRGQILCLVGPPGVGKTSLGKSIAKATGREFVRVSLGGVRDESEIRGHRRTYIGSMPGKIIQGMKKAKVTNPLFLLDEIDKLGSDWRGDPTSALLEVLDPEQNGTFNDHYLEVDYDLSDVMFVTTANTLNMPQPLLDRMEIIRVSGYTEDEKVEIAKGYLIEKERAAHGLTQEEWSVEESALRAIIRTYTRESGVRNLEREIAKLARKALNKIETTEVTEVVQTKDNIETFLGVPKYHYGMAELHDLIGITTGLAWTEVGGELLSIEAVTLPGKGKITITGKLGDVMQESVQAAISHVRSKAPALGINPILFEKRDIHIHVPEGATPKDGPSAGIAMFTSIVSVLTGIPVRKDVAMTGEITLRGRILPIGGLKEKLLAAHRGGIKTILIPKENKKDLVDIPDNIKADLDIHCLEDADDVLNYALVHRPIPIEWKEDLTTPPASSGTSAAESVVTH